MQVNQVNSTKKSTQRRVKNTKSNTSRVQITLTTDEFGLFKNETETETASESILPDIIEQEITISEIDHFETEEEVVGIDWLK